MRALIMLTAVTLTMGCGKSDPDPAAPPESPQSEPSAQDAAADAADRVRDLVEAIGAKDEATAKALIHPRFLEMTDVLIHHAPECGEKLEGGGVMNSLKLLGPQVYLSDPKSYTISHDPGDQLLSVSGWGDKEDGIEEFDSVEVMVQKPGDLRRFAWHLTLGRGGEHTDWVVIGVSGGEVERDTTGDAVDPYVLRCCEAGYDGACLEAARHFARHDDQERAIELTAKACTLTGGTDCEAKARKLVGVPARPQP